MKRKNGFTLIELLAVIVILAIIAVIAVPIVLNIIDDSKENTTLRSAEMYLDAVEMSIATATLKNKNIEPKTYNIMSDGNICLATYNKTTTSETCTDTDLIDNNEILKVEVKGDIPNSGTITITNGNISDLSIVLNEKEITKNSKGELVYAKMLDEICTYQNNGVTEKTAGAKYECKVDPNKDPYTFYVLNTRNKSGEIITESSIDKEAVSINLIMAQNINSDGTPTTKAIKESEKNANGGIYNLVAWTSEDDYGGLQSYNEDIGCFNENGCVLNDKGPITAMNFLSEATKTWTNTNEMIINKFTECSWNAPCLEKTMAEYVVNARMPYYNEVSDASTTKIWLIEYLSGEFDDVYGVEGRENGINDIYGYWTLSTGTLFSTSAWKVDYRGGVGASLDLSDYDALYGVANIYEAGVRPVITLKI